MLRAIYRSLRLAGPVPMPPMLQHASSPAHLPAEATCIAFRALRSNHSRASIVTHSASLSSGGFGNHGGNGPPFHGGGGGGGGSSGSGGWGRGSGLLSIVGLSLLAAGPAAAAKPKEKPPPEVILDTHANDGTEMTVEKVTDMLWKVAGPIATNLGFSGCMGLMAGLALKKVGKFLAVLVGIAFAALQGLAHSGMITVNWTHIQSTVTATLDANSDGKLDEQDFKMFMNNGLGMLSAGVPSVGGFLAGFVMGLRM